MRRSKKCRGALGSARGVASGCLHTVAMFNRALSGTRATARGRAKLAVLLDQVTLAKASTVPSRPHVNLMFLTEAFTPKKSKIEHCVFASLKCSVLSARNFEGCRGASAQTEALYSCT